MSTENEKRTLVIDTESRVTWNPTTNVYAARIREFGLTGYGRTAEEAHQHVWQMVDAAIAAHREAGTFAEWLVRSGVAYHWEDQEDTNTPS